MVYADSTQTPTKGKRSRVKVPPGAPLHQVRQEWANAAIEAPEPFNSSSQLEQCFLEAAETFRQAVVLMLDRENARRTGQEAAIELQDRLQSAHSERMNGP